MFKKLEEQYKVRDYTARDIVWRKLTRSELSNYQSITKYGETIKKIKTELAEISCEILVWIITIFFFHGLGETYEEFVIIIFIIRTKDDKGQFQEPELDSVMELLKDRKRRHAENDNPTKILKSGGKKDNRRGKQQQYLQTFKKKKNCGYYHNS